VFLGDVFVERGGEVGVVRAVGERSVYEDELVKRSSEAWSSLCIAFV
jgi:hypothetical protein